jgi:lipoprotein-anchoring transpeptidase ErfK/SrfK
MVLTDVGLETVLVFEEGLDLPHFAAFPLLDSDAGRIASQVSTGAPGFATPPCSHKIYRKHPRDLSYPYSGWLPHASYFVGGIAFHESPDVPAFAASHGCVRVPRDDAPIVYSFAVFHTPVKVLK